MPLWLLKFLPLKSLFKKLLPYWKPILAGIIFIFYSLMLKSCVTDNVNAKWETKEAARIEAEIKAENKALSEAAKLKEQQDSAAAEREAALILERDAAKERAKEALAEADKQRRLNNASTRKLEDLQAADPNGPQLIGDGVRDILTSGQDKVRSRRQP